MDAVSHPIEEVAAVTGQPRSAVFRAVNAGHLKTYRVGRRRHATHAAVVAWVAFLAKCSEDGRPVSYRHDAKPSDSSAANKRVGKTKATA